VKVEVECYRCSVSKSRSLVRSTWPVFMRTCVVARLTPFLKPVFLQSPSPSTALWAASYRSTTWLRLAWRFGKYGVLIVSQDGGVASNVLGCGEW
jgi:hypothetical protein